MNAFQVAIGCDECPQSGVPMSFSGDLNTLTAPGQKHTCSCGQEWRLMFQTVVLTRASFENKETGELGVKEEHEVTELWAPEGALHISSLPVPLVPEPGEDEGDEES